MRLFWFLNVHFLLRRRLQTALCLLGIALGVAVVVGIETANHSAIESFRRSVDLVAGKATHQVTAADGADLPEAVLAAALATPGVRAAAPVIEESAPVAEAGEEPLRFLGTDMFLDGAFRAFTPREAGGGGDFTRFLTEPGLVILPADFARRHHLDPGSTVTVTVGTRRHALTAFRTWEPGELKGSADNLAVLDIAAAQELFGKVGRLDRVDLIATDRAAAALGRALGPAADVVRPETRTGRVEGMIASYRLNLFALSLLALFVGAFLIYNTLTFSVIQRRRQIGIFRCIGMARMQVGALFVLEAVVLGAAGSALGLALGLGLASVATRAVELTISNFYAAVSVKSLSVPGALVLKAFALGIGASLSAAVVPAFEAASIPPTAAATRSEMDHKMRRWAPWFAGAGIATLALSALLAVAPSHSSAPGFASAFGVTIGFAFLSPLATIGLARLLGRIAGRAFGLPGVLGARNITASLSRTGPAIAALMVALAMVVGVALMVRSFRSTLDEWILRTLRADVYIQPAGRGTQKNAAFLPGALVRELEAHPGVEGVDVLRQRTLDLGGRPANLSAVRTDLIATRSTYHFLQGNQRDAFTAMQGGDAVIASETLAAFTGIGLDSVLRLPTPSGIRPFRVAGVYRDYSADGGQILMDRSAYLRHWQDARVNNAALYLGPGIDPEKTVSALRRSLGARHQLLIRSNAGLRAEVFRIFDSTFAITRVMQAMAVVVAVCGILSALMALLVERTRELGTLLALGMTRGALRGMLCVESACIGLIASAIGAAAGIMLALVLVFVINVRSFGWTIRFHLFGDTFAAALAVAVTAALLATVYPAVRLARLPIASAIREE